MSLENCYNKGKIYKIVDNTTGNIYIGSTCKPLSARLACHRASYKIYLNTGKPYYSSFEILKNNNFDIILIEEVNVTIKIKNKLMKRIN